VELLPRFSAGSCNRVCYGCRIRRDLSGALLACGLLYTSTFKALTRFIPALKTCYVASAFAAIVFLPFAYAGINVPSGALPFAAWVFIDAAIMQIFLDIKDIESDREAGLRTIPLLLGRKSTFQMLYVLVIISALPPLFWGTFHRHFPPMVGALAVAPLLSVVPFRIAQKGAYFGYLLESGKFVTWPLLLALGRALLV
jgi:geranylgeranylglycerol-phosphate geranylgeranyltransferase